MSLPTPYVVQRKAYTAGATDSHGNPVESFADAVDVDVHGWGPPSADVEQSQAGTSVVRDLDLLAPVGTVSNPNDRWIVDGHEYKAIGYPEDFSRGPWQWAAGVRINLERAEEAG